MPLERIGILTPEQIKILRDNKILFINRDRDVWIDDTDKARAMPLIETSAPPKGSKEKTYTLHGFTLRVPENMSLNIRYDGNSCGTPHGRARVNIHEFSKPLNGLDTLVVTKSIPKIVVKGQEIEAHVASFSPAYAGIVISDDNGLPLIEITPGNVFALFDTEGNTDLVKRVYEELLLFAVALANHEDERSKALFEEIWTKQAPEREALEIKGFEEVVLGAIRREIKAYEERIIVNTTNISETQKNLFIYLQAIETDSARLDLARSTMNNGMKEKVRSEWGKIKNLEKTGAVKKITITGKTISFITRMIEWTPPKKGFRIAGPSGLGADPTQELSVSKPVELGEYSVTVTIEPFGVSIRNLTKTLSYAGDIWHHPHVRQSVLCYGNMTKTLPEFVARREFEAVIMMMLKWLQNVATDDAWGKGIFFWIEDFREKNKDKETDVEDEPAQGQTPVPETR